MIIRHNGILASDILPKWSFLLKNRNFRILAQGFALSPISSFNSTLNSLVSGSWDSEEIFSDLSEVDSKSKLAEIDIAIPIPMAITAIIPAITALFNWKNLGKLVYKLAGLLRLVLNKIIQINIY